MSQQTYDYDYAHSLLVECVIHDPGNHVYQDSFLMNLQRKYQNNKRGALLKLGSRGRFKKAVAKGAWAEVLQLGPPLLKSNPWDVASLRGLAQACAALGFSETELRYLRNALEAKPNDAAVNRHCAKSLARVGRFDDAILCWQRVDEAEKGNREAQEMIAELQVAKSRKLSATELPATGRSRPDPPAGDSSVSRRQKTIQSDNRQGGAQQDQRDSNAAAPTPRTEIQLTERQQLEQTLVMNPTNTAAYLELAELHVGNCRFGEAVHLLSKGLSASGHSLPLQERLEDVEILRKQEQLEIAEKRAEGNRDADRRELADQLRADLNRYQLDVFDRRSQRYPEDLELQYQVGIRLKQCGNYRQAVEMFTKSIPLPERQASATFELAECLQRLRKYDQAIERYKDAGKLAAQLDLPEIQRLALYRTGLLSAGLGNHRAAEEAFSELVDEDRNYKDAASRLDKIREMRHKG